MGLSRRAKVACDLMVMAAILVGIPEYQCHPHSVATIVDDPQYLSQSFVTSSNSKRMPQVGVRRSARQGSYSQ
jgi:hypothetical protein